MADRRAAVTGSNRNLAPQRNIRAVSEEESNPARRIHVSNFSVTMSTNRVVPGDEIHEDDIAMLQGVCDYVFGEHMGDIVQFYEAGPDPSDFTLDETTPISELLPDGSRIAAISVVEVGTTKHGRRLHTHTAIGVRHRGKMRLNREKIIELANEYLEQRGYPDRIKYLHITARGPTAQDYVRMGGAAGSFEDYYPSGGYQQYT
jgi:hypothetical protein